MADTVVKDVKVLEFGEWREGDLVIDEGLIAGHDASGVKAKIEVDAQGAYCFPGAVDLHVHFNEPGRTDWEGFETGSATAAAGGVAYVADMPLNSIPATTNVPAFSTKLAAIGSKSYVDFELWGGVLPGNEDDLQPLAEAGVMGYKAFMSPSGVDEFNNSNASVLRKAMEKIAPTGLRLALHAEDPGVLEPAVAALASRETAADWLASRPIDAEISAVKIAIELAEETACPLMIVHVSAPEVLEVIHEAQDRGVDLTCETCPHYLLLSSEEAEALGTNAKCAPPLRPPETVSAMLEMFVNDGIDTIGSDHSPSPPSMKAGKSFYDAWGGIAGIQHGLAFLIDLFGLDNSEHLQVLQDAFALMPAGQIGLENKGRLSAEAEANFFLVNPLAEQRSLPAEDLLCRHKVSAYLGFDLELAITSSWLRGIQVTSGGKVFGSPAGKCVPGQAFKG